VMVLGIDISSQAYGGGRLSDCPLYFGQKAFPQKARQCNIIVQCARIISCYGSSSAKTCGCRTKIESDLVRRDGVLKICSFGNSAVTFCRFVVFWVGTHRCFRCAEQIVQRTFLPHVTSLLCLRENTSNSCLAASLISDL
jgi:hypothetical protein